MNAAMRFAFPLDVYAWLIAREGGRVDYLHYGLFERPDEPAAIVQQRAADFLFTHLPPPCKVLDVGSGLGTTLARLLATGYRAQGITPDAAQVEAIRARLGEQAPIACCRLEEFAADAGHWQVLLFQESAQYIDGLDLFEAADRLLTADGEIVIMDEFALRRDEPERVALHYLPHFLVWAERSGFALRTKIDLSVQAAPTVDWLLRQTEAHREPLQRELGIDAALLTHLMAANRQYQARYRAGRYGYFLLRLQRKRKPLWRAGRIAGEVQVQQMRQLFAAVFGQTMSAAHWQWKYGEGRGVGIGVWNEAGELVAHYGGITRDARLRGQAVRAFCAADFMVAPAGRGALTRQGPAFLAAATFLEHELGYGAPHLVGIGFPNRRAFALPEKLGLYRGVLTRIVEVSLASTASGPRWREKLRPLALAMPEGQAVAEACWQEMQADLRDWNVLVRDGQWLAHRFGACHDQRAAQGYRCHVVRHRLTNRPLGLIVLRLAADGRCELLDLVGALRHLPALLLHARRLAAQLGAGELFLWASEDMLPLLQLPGEARLTDIEVLVPGNGWTDGPACEELAGRWWLTGGDTDCH